MTTGQHQHSSHGDHGEGHGHGHGHDAYDPSNLLRADAFYSSAYAQVIKWLDIAPGTTALEAGSGAGGVTELLAGAVGAGGSVAALDLTPELLGTTRERMEQSHFKDCVTYHEGDIQHLPFEDGRFDLVWSSRTIHHLQDQLAGVKELRRVLKPGGRLALREGGLRPRYLPTDLGIGQPGLEDRLEAAFQKWFQKEVRSADGAVNYPYGWTHLLRDAGLKNVGAKTFLLEFLQPYDDVQTEYMKAIISRWVASEERLAFISEEDGGVIRQLIDSASPNYAFKRQDLHYLEGLSVYVGQA